MIAYKAFDIYIVLTKFNRQQTLHIVGSKKLLQDFLLVAAAGGLKDQAPILL